MINKTYQKTNLSYNVRISASSAYYKNENNISLNRKQLQFNNNEIFFPTLGAPAGFFLDNTLLDVMVK